MQYALIAALTLPEHYYRTNRQAYEQRRNYFVQTLADLNFQVTRPQGAYYLLANIASLGWGNDLEVANKLLEKAKVAVVTGSFIL